MYLIVDHFLDPEEADRLLAQILASETRFVPSLVGHGSNAAEQSAIRSSLRLPGRVGVDLHHFTGSVRDRFAEFCRALGQSEFRIHHIERSIVAHGDADFYRRHTDVGGARDGHVRLISCVYYLHRQPCRFSGGELVIDPILGKMPGETVVPRHNRLVVFPSFLPHEVMPTRVPSREFADSRFSINCWLRREIASRVPGSRGAELPGDRDDLDPQ